GGRQVGAGLSGPRLNGESQRVGGGRRSHTGGQRFGTGSGGVDAGPNSATQGGAYSGTGDHGGCGHAVSGQPIRPGSAPSRGGAARERIQATEQQPGQKQPERRGAGRSAAQHQPTQAQID